MKHFNSSQKCDSWPFYFQHSFRNFWSQLKRRPFNQRQRKCRTKQQFMCLVQVIDKIGPSPPFIPHQQHIKMWILNNFTVHKFYDRHHHQCNSFISIFFWFCLELSFLFQRNRLEWDRNCFSCLSCRVS